MTMWLMALDPRDGVVQEELDQIVRDSLTGPDFGMKSAIV